MSEREYQCFGCKQWISEDDVAEVVCAEGVCCESCNSSYEDGIGAHLSCCDADYGPLYAIPGVISRLK